MAIRIRTFDWATTPLGPIDRWPQSVRTAVDLIVSAGFPMILLWGAELTQIYNDGYRTLMGNKHPAGLGQATRESWPEVWEINAPIYERVRNGETLTFNDALYPITRSGKLEDAWFSLSYSPLHDESAAIAGVLVTVFETTGRIKESAARDAAEAVCQQSEERFRAFVNASSDVVYRMSPDWSQMRELDGQGFLADVTQPTENWMDQYILADDRRMVREAIDRAIRTKSMFELEHRVHRVDGTSGWTLSRAVPILNDRDEINEWLGAAKDITVRKEIAEAMSESEELFREFGAASTDVLWMRNAESLQWDYLSAGFEQIYGVPCEKALAGDSCENWTELIVEEDRDTALRGIERVRNGERATFEYRIRRPVDGEIRWLRNTDFPMRDAGGKVTRIGGVGTDITAIKRAEDHQRILLAELQHRVRNTLAVIRSIARRTAEHSDSAEGMLAHFEGRLDAFSRVQAALTRTAEAKISLVSLVEDELVAHAARDGEQLRIDGPEVMLAPKSAERLSLAIHELTTNAVKHGALSSERGKIRVGWRTQGLNGSEMLILKWEESGVEIDPDGVREAGFGMELLRQSLPYDLQAKTKVDLRSEGLRFELRMPIPRPNGVG